MTMLVEGMRMRKLINKSALSDSQSDKVHPVPTNVDMLFQFKYVDAAKTSSSGEKITREIDAERHKTYYNIDESKT